MKHLGLARKNREVNPESWEHLYETEIIRKIRKRYSVNQELAILRQRDTKTEEFAEYNAFVEKCKAEVKEELGIEI
jgi:broad specificity phosphatase PhoE